MLKLYFSCDETLITYSLSNFQIYNTALLTIVTMLHYIPGAYFYFITGCL